MATLSSVLGIASGLRFIAPELEPHIMAATSVGMLVTYAVICRVFAIQAGRGRNSWTIAGLLGGLFATAALLVVTEVTARRPEG